ncbi:MAG TPA: hypothetical protein VHS55_05990 [Solirubrobacteraceae bacterium]|jgi:hypothetical protein|nr:hypothetical protein [Solirubrobacteraceae bacterium]
MTDARIEKIYVDRVRAGEFLDQADRFRSDADTASLGAESQSVLLHNATVCACDAILQGVGLRVTSGDRAHVLRLETALEQLDGDTEDLLESLDASRERRNEASYTASFVAKASLADAREATSELLERTRALLS